MKIVEALKRAIVNSSKAVELLDQTARGIDDQSRLLDERLEQLVQGSANQSGLLSEKLSQLVKASTNQSTLQSEKSEQLIEGLANQSGLLNEKFEQLIQGSTNQSTLLGEKLEQLVQGITNQSGLLNEKLEQLVQGSINQSSLLNEKLEQLVKASTNQSTLQHEKFQQLIHGVLNLSGLVNDKLTAIISRQDAQMDLEKVTVASVRGLMGGANVAVTDDSPPIHMPSVSEKQIEPAQSRSRLICVGTGRDGTVSICKMIQDVFDATDGRSAAHEYCARELYQAFCDYEETRDEMHADEIRRLIAECPYDCIVGNGYAAILPFFREQWPGEVKLVHIRRADRDACVASLVKNCELFPASYRYYTSEQGAAMKRMAAFHFGEMTKAEWERLPIAAKLGWYYDKTHSLIDLHKNLFSENVEILTETLNEESTRRTIALLVSGSEAVLPMPVRLNSHVFDVASVGEQHRNKIMWLIGQLNWERLGEDVYGMDYFIAKFCQWAEYQIKYGGRNRHNAEETAATLARARVIVRTALKSIEALESKNLDRNTADVQPIAHV